MTRATTAFLICALAMGSACRAAGVVGDDTDRGSIDCADAPSIVAALSFQSTEACDPSVLNGVAIARGGWAGTGFWGPLPEDPTAPGQSFDIDLPQSGWGMGLGLGTERYVSWCDLCTEGESTTPQCSFGATAGSLKVTWERDPESIDTDVTDTDVEPFAEGWISGTAQVTLSDGVTTFPFQHTWDRAPFRQVRPCW